MDKNRYFQIRSGKYTKTKVADIQRLYSKWLWLVMAVYKPLLADAANRRYMNFSELYKVGMKFEPNYQGMQSVDIQHDTNSVIFL
ncbi:hypothetical protein M1P97_16570 [Parabacteroides sp. GYB001]|uniref:hypothetical protein n=1 Tax=Parabacteroides leei TaxID=2939491 RepID=UPI0020183B0E|nr:hypothetical protein [Parabacteroides leei]MCL3852901.1 hypothetical protein [Parabacteroides leei]